MTTALPDSLLNWLLRTSFEASILILAVFGLRLLLGKRLSPAWRIGLWLVVGLKLLLPACIPASFGLGHWWAETAEHAPVAPPAVVMAAEQFTPPISPPLDAVALAVPSSLPLLAFCLWLAGAVTVLGVALARQWCFEGGLRSRPIADETHLLGLVTRLLQIADVRQRISVVLMPAGTTPAVIGFRHARLLLPEDWSTRFDDSALRHILLHEILHIRQKDLIWNWAALALQALHWFNPLVWLVVARFQSDRELRCDAGALALLSPNERLAYGHTLLRVQQTFFAPPAIAGLAPWVRNHPTLRQRITMIAEPTRNHPWLHALFAVAFGLITCYAFTTVRAAEDEKEVPARDRSREGARTRTEGSGEKSVSREREGDGKMKEGDRDGDRPKTGERDGMRKKTGEGDGAPRTGPRDGEKKKTGARDGEGPKKSGERDGARKEGDGEREGTSTKNTGTSKSLTMRVTKGGEAVVIGGEEVAAGRLRGYLHNLLADQESPKATITADPEVTFEALMKVVDAVRDNGIKNPDVKAAAKE